MSEGELSGATWPELSTPPSSHAAVWPMGSLEQHGPHLPFATDTVIATAVARRIHKQLVEDSASLRWWLLPELAMGASGEHQEFPGTVSIGTQATAHVIREVGRSVGTWAKQLVIVSGHGGNTEALADAVSLLRDEGRNVAWVPCMAAGHRNEDIHAGHTETSIMLALDELAVRKQLATAGHTEHPETLLHRLRERGVREVSPTGVLGDPTTASAAAGHEYLHQMVEGALRRIRHGGVDAGGMLIDPNRHHDPRPDRS